MSLVPLIVSICFQVQEANYSRACEAALAQGASQTGIAKNFEVHARQIENRLKRLIPDERTAALMFSFASFSYRFYTNQESTLSTKIAPETTAQLSFKQNYLGLGIRYDF